MVLSKAQPQPSDCMLTSLRWVCSTLLGTLTEEQYGFDQGFTQPSAGKATLRGSAVLTGSPLIDRYARFDQQEATATASSVFTSAPQDQPSKEHTAALVASVYHRRWLPSSPWLGEEVDEVLLVASWFRRHPEERARTIRAAQASLWKDGVAL